MRYKVYKFTNNEGFFNLPECNTWYLNDEDKDHFIERWHLEEYADLLVSKGPLIEYKYEIDSYEKAPEFVAVLIPETSHIFNYFNTDIRKCSREYRRLLDIPVYSRYISIVFIEEYIVI